MRLGGIWYNLPWATKLAIIDQVTQFDGSLSAVKFKTHGCIYFKEDLQRVTGSSEAIQLNLVQQDLTLERYAIGPLTKAELWNSSREQLDIDRGPCTLMA